MLVILSVFVLCCQRPSQETMPAQDEKIKENVKEENFTDTIVRISDVHKEGDFPFTMDSLWKYHGDSDITSGRGNKPFFYSCGLEKDLYYGFYCIFSRLYYPLGPSVEIAHVIVSYKPSKKWMSRDTSQKICELTVYDKLFRPRVASFGIGDEMSQIKEDFVKRIDNIFYYRNGDVLYCVESVQDTIRHYRVLYSCVDFEWDTLHKHIKKHFEQYEKYR